MAGPLQHQTTALPLPVCQPRDLRKDRDTGYAWLLSSFGQPGAQHLEQFR